jgi:hypothetical protein
MPSLFSFPSMHLPSIPSMPSMHSMHFPSIHFTSIFSLPKKTEPNLEKQQLDDQITRTIMTCYVFYIKENNKENTFYNKLLNYLIRNNNFIPVFDYIKENLNEPNYAKMTGVILEILKAIVTGTDTTISGITVKKIPPEIIRLTKNNALECKIKITDIKKFSFVNIRSILDLNDIFENSEPCICAVFHRIIDKRLMSINACTIFINFVNELVENNSANFGKKDIMNFMNLFEKNDLMDFINSENRHNLTKYHNYLTKIKKKYIVTGGLSAILIIEGNRILKIFTEIYTYYKNKTNIIYDNFNRAILEIYTLLYLEYFNIDFIPKINKILHINPNITNINITNINIINNTLGFEMNYLGETLYSLIETNSISQIELFDIIIGLCNNLAILQNIGVIHEDLNIRNITIIKNGSKIEKVNIIDFGNSVIYRFDGKFINNYSDKDIIEFNPRLHFGSPNLKAYDLLGFILSLYEKIKGKYKFKYLSAILEELYIFDLDEIMKLTSINQIKNIFRIVCMKNEDYEGNFGIVNYKKNNDTIIINDNKSNRIELNLNENISPLYPEVLSKVLLENKEFIEEATRSAASTSTSTSTSTSASTSASASASTSASASAP